MRSLWGLLVAALMLSAQEYQLGQGIKAGPLPLYIGGYVTVDYLERRDDYQRARLDDVALIAYGAHERLSYLVELEMKEPYIREWGKIDRTRTDEHVSVERAYADYAFSDNVEARIGKFNTPVGYWSQTPINVLRDAASNPYFAYIVYPRYTTGVQLGYEDHLGGGNAYTVILQNNDDLDDKYNNIFTDRHYGVGVEREGDRLSCKGNIGHFRTTSGDSFYYFLMAMQYEEEQYKLTAEFGARRSESTWTVPYAFYLQGVYHLRPRHDLIGRFETYKIDEGAYRQEEIGMVGYTYRPVYPVTFKAEYQWHSYINESQLLLSFAVLF